MSKIIYKALYGHKNVELARGLIHVFPFGVIGEQYQNTIKPHSHNEVFQVFLILEGETEIIHNKEHILVKAPCFITIPKNIEHGFQHHQKMGGWIISLSDQMLEHLVQTDAEVTQAFDQFMIVPISDSEITQKLQKTLLNAVEEYHAKDAGRFTMLQYIVGQFIIQLYRLQVEEYQTIALADNSATIYFRRFKQLVKNTNSYKKMIDEYANDLNITTGHLNRICNQIAGKAPKEIIIDFFITEAKVLLINPQNNVTDVCFQLGFEDPSYFSRVFKKKTGLSPNEFRKNQNSNK